MSTDLAKFLPLNRQEHENEMRTIVNSHMRRAGGESGGNPSQWVVDAVAEAFQRGFGVGFNAGLITARTPPAPPPKYKVQLPPAEAKRLRGPDDEVIDV